MSFNSAKREISKMKAKEDARSYSHSGKAFLDASKARARAIVRARTEALNKKRK